VRQVIRLVFVAVLAIQWSGCSTSTAFINYESIDNTVKVSSDSLHGTNLGMVKGDEGGAIWNNCTEKATESVREMIYKTKAAGGNAIANVKWYATGNSTPSCKKGWGYLVIWPFILTPLFMSTAVTGDMIKMNAAEIPAKGKGKKAKHADLYFIPDTAEGQLALAREIASGI
jgi:uncharacterized protein YbjQ (UPF0145 family)